MKFFPKTRPHASPVSDNNMHFLAPQIQRFRLNVAQHVVKRCIFDAEREMTMAR